MINASQSQTQYSLTEYANAKADTLALMEHVSYPPPLISPAMSELISITKLKDVFHAQMDV